MAAVTHRVSTPLTTNVASYVSGAFTPVAGDLLVVFAVVTGTATNPATCTASANGMTFTQVGTAVKVTSGDRLYAFVSDQLVPASPVSMTVTIGTGADAGTGTVISAASVSGMTKVGTTAVKQSAVQSNIPGANTPTATFGASTTAGNPALLFVATGTNPAALLPGVSLVELADTGYATPTTGAHFSSADNVGAVASISTGSDPSTEYGLIGLELDASGAAAATSFVRRRGPSYRR